MLQWLLIFGLFILLGWIVYKLVNSEDCDDDDADFWRHDGFKP